MKRTLAVIIVLIAAAAAGLFIFGGDRDEKLIRKELVRLTRRVSIEEGESELKRAAKNQGVLRLFTESCVIRAGYPVPEIDGKEMLTGALYTGTRTVKYAHVGFRDIEIIIKKNRVEARVNLSVLTTYPDLESGEEITDGRQIVMQWKKLSDNWKIAEVREVEILR